MYCMSTGVDVPLPNVMWINMFAHWITRIKDGVGTYCLLRTPSRSFENGDGSFASDAPAMLVIRFPWRRCARERCR
jgi:hypothetical protein